MRVDAAALAAHNFEGEFEMTPQIALAIFALFSVSPSLLANDNPSDFRGCAEWAQDIHQQIKQARNEGLHPTDRALEKALKQAGSHCMSVKKSEHQEEEKTDAAHQDVAPSKTRATIGILPRQETAHDNPPHEECRKHLNAINGTREHNWRSPCKKASLTF